MDIKTHGDLGPLFKARVAARQQFKNPAKSREGHGYGYADLNEVIGSTIGALNAEGLDIIQWMTDAGEGRIGVTTQLVHASGAYMEATSTMPLSDGNKRMSAEQATGAAVSYLRRYVWVALCGLPQHDNDAAPARTEGPAKSQPDALASWRQRLASCTDPATLATWLGEARTQLDDGQRRQLGAALKQRAEAVGTTINALLEAA